MGLPFTEMGKTMWKADFRKSIVNNFFDILTSFLLSICLSMGYLGIRA